jgi:pentatricopeptide repeat protein
METLPSPDPLSNLNLYLSAWVNSGLPNRAQEAHSILKKAEEDPSITLNTGAYNAVLHTYASLVEQDKSNVTNAAELLKHMWNDGIECDVASYSSLLLAYSKARDPDGAMEFLMQMERAAAKTQLFPNTICYNIGKIASWCLAASTCFVISQTFVFSTRCFGKARDGRSRI